MLLWYGTPILIGLALIVGGFEIRQPIICAIGLFVFVVAFPVFVVPYYLRKRMEREALKLEESFPQMGFSYQYKFVSHNGIYYIDYNGRLGVVRKYHPTKLDMVDLRNITDICTKDGKFLMGTSLVSCSFRLDGKTHKIYTLRVSNGQMSMKSREVLEAISKADALCETLKKAREAALKDGFNAGVAK